MSDIDLSALDEALETVGGVVDKIAADKRASEAMERVEDCRIKAIPERDPARCFFTSLALGLEAAVATDEQIQTAATDGERLLVNPEWVLAKSPEELYGVVIGHEPAHNAMEHFRRGIGMEDQSVANQAMDLEINPLLRDAGFTLPPEAIFPGAGNYQNCPPDLTMEEYYGILSEEPKPEGQPGDGPGNDPGKCGGSIPAPDQAKAEHLANQWKGKVAAAAQQASKRGDMPGSLQRWVERILKPRVDPWEILREYMTRAVKAGDQNWCRPDRRVLSQGLYLPTRRSNELGDVVLLVDTSGSVGDDELALMAGFLEGVLAANPGKLTIIYHHSNVYNVVDWIPEDGPLKLTKDESGGTSHVPAFQEIENRGLDPAVVVALTDLDSRFPPDPGIPTIWVDVEGGHSPPFGKYVDVSV
jgi:predicted metal-dependent peptidase